MKKIAVKIAESMGVIASYSGNRQIMYLRGERSEEALVAIVNGFGGEVNFDILIED